MLIKKNGIVGGSGFHASLGIRVGIHTAGILGSGRRGIVCGTFCRRNAGFWREIIMMWTSSRGASLPRISLNYGDDGMKMGNERYALFWSAYEEWVMKKKHKK